MKNVLLLKAGEAAASVRLLVGDYDRWFLQTLGLSGYRFDIVPAFQGVKLPEPVSSYDAVMMTGSPASVTRVEPWMERAAALHEDLVPEPPEGTVVLAGNANTAIQALAFRPCSRGVQFHPEVQPDAMRALIQARAERLEEDAVTRGQPPGERVPRLLAGIAPTPHGRQILVNFLEHFT